MDGEDAVVLCAASAYEEKYYLNPDFESMPEQIRQEIQILCVLYTQKVGGILILEFAPDGSLQFRTEALENDFSYDEIGSALEIKQIQREKRELLESLELYYRVMMGQEDWEALEREADDGEDSGPDDPDEDDLYEDDLYDDDWDEGEPWD